MLSTFICGSFQNKENEDNLSPCSSTSTRSRRSGSYRNKENKNRYANRGLDKFNELLSELEEKKQKIYTQKGAEDIALVQFVISSDNELKPVVVVKMKKDASSKTTHDLLHVPVDQLNKHTHNHEASSNNKLQREEIPGCSSSHSNLEQQFYYFPVVVILILLFLAIYGKPFAILCTCIGWYLIPILRRPDRNSSSSNNSSQSRRKLKGKKEHYSRRSSVKTFVRSGGIDGSSSPTSVLNGPNGMSPPPQQHDLRRR
ncbi:hypothetical protein LIER_10858 [Lithospermum erythrorhizon]|uniref:ZCF37 n=1 Tax=Lithospermum erythrorhizon TaxID=34254 RepID=A0AAV3PKW6_LITER